MTSRLRSSIYLFIFFFVFKIKIKDKTRTRWSFRLFTQPGCPVIKKDVRVSGSGEKNNKNKSGYPPRTTLRAIKNCDWSGEFDRGNAFRRSSKNTRKPLVWSPVCCPRRPSAAPIVRPGRSSPQDGLFVGTRRRAGRGGAIRRCALISYYESERPAAAAAESDVGREQVRRGRRVVVLHARSASSAVQIYNIIYTYVHETRYTAATDRP